MRAEPGPPPVASTLDHGLAVPVLVMGDAAQSIEGYVHLFGDTCRLVMCSQNPQGPIAGAGVGCVVLLTATATGAAVGNPLESPIALRVHVYIDEVHAVVRRAIGRGAQVLVPSVRGEGV